MIGRWCYICHALGIGMPTRRKTYSLDYSKLHIKRKPYDRLMYMLDAGNRRASYIMVHMRATSFINNILGSLFIMTVRRINFSYVGDYAYVRHGCFIYFNENAKYKKYQEYHSRCPRKCNQLLNGWSVLFPGYNYACYTREKKNYVLIGWPSK